MKKAEIIGILRLGLEEALNIVAYYTELECKNRGIVDPVVKSSVENLNRLLAYSEYPETNSEDEHPLYQH